MTQHTGEAGEFQWFGPDEFPDDELIADWTNSTPGRTTARTPVLQMRGAPAAWRIAGALVQLRNEINALAPNRSKASDGTVGDLEHRSRASRHNPNAAGVVTAFDCTDDPANGCAIHAIAEQLIAKAKAGQTNPAFEYVVSNGRIASRSEGWAWRKYTGKNPHTHHVHFAVGRGPDKAPGEPLRRHDAVGAVGDCTRGDGRRVDAAGRSGESGRGPREDRRDGRRHSRP